MSAGASAKHMALTVRQPWASLLVMGIKCVEGRSWSTSHRGQLWIHSGAKRPKPAEIQDAEAFYSSTYASEGLAVAFPASYPTGVVLGVVDLVDVVAADEFEDSGATAALPTSVMLESDAPWRWCCERPRRLTSPPASRGAQGVWELPRELVHAVESQESESVCLRLVVFPTRK